jgi:hypothetical protein
MKLENQYKFIDDFKEKIYLSNFTEVYKFSVCIKMMKCILIKTSAFPQFIYTKRGINAHIKRNKVLR